MKPLLLMARPSLAQIWCTSSKKGLYTVIAYMCTATNESDPMDEKPSLVRLTTSDFLSQGTTLYAKSSLCTFLNICFLRGPGGGPHGVWTQLHSFLIIRKSVGRKGQLAGDPHPSSHWPIAESQTMPTG